MGDKTGIEWADATWNPIRGCSRVSEGCKNCYAETFASRFDNHGQPYEGLIARGGQWNGNIKLVDHMLDQPLKWKKPRRIFVNSMSDLFHENVPFDFIDKVFAVMALAPQHTFQILTKRPERMLQYTSRVTLSRMLESCVGSDGVSVITGYSTNDIARSFGVCPLTDQGIVGGLPLQNVWLGVSVEDQKTADERIPLLLQTPAAVRWISAEPLLGKIRLSTCTDSLRYMTSEYYSYLDFLRGLRTTYNNGEKEEFKQYEGLDWVVVGGESGKDARPMHPDWVRSLRDQCVNFGVPFLFKQWGEWLPGDAPGYPENADYLCEIGKGFYFEDHQWMDKVGKKKAGRLLDGRTWDEYPDIKL